MGAPFDPKLLLREAGLKATRPREVILHHLAGNHGPFSVRDVHEALGTRGGDAVTAYRALTAFEDAGLVRRCDFGDGIARYELRDAHDDHHHHHVICVECRQVEAVEDCQMKALDAKVQELGYTRVRHVLEFTGICRRCSAG